MLDRTGLTRAGTAQSAMERMKEVAAVAAAHADAVDAEARFPRDREALLASLDALLASGRLDADRPAPRPLWL